MAHLIHQLTEHLCRSTMHELRFGFAGKDLSRYEPLDDPRARLMCGHLITAYSVKERDIVCTTDIPLHGSVLRWGKMSTRIIRDPPVPRPVDPDNPLRVLCAWMGETEHIQTSVSQKQKYAQERSCCCEKSTSATINEQNQEMNRQN